MNAAFANVQFQQSVWQGVDRIEQYLSDEITRCGNSQKYVLAGYSQGALSIHLYLTQRASAGALSRIAAVGLLADPAKNQNPGEYVYSDGFLRVLQGDSVYNATGVYQKIGLPGGSLPSGITGRTISVCFDRDYVCAPGVRSIPVPGLYGSVHTATTRAATRSRRWGVGSRTRLWKLACPRSEFRSWHRCPVWVGPGSRSDDLISTKPKVTGSNPVGRAEHSAHGLRSRAARLNRAPRRGQSDGQSFRNRAGESGDETESREIVPIGRRAVPVGPTVREMAPATTPRR